MNHQTQLKQWIYAHEELMQRLTALRCMSEQCYLSAGVIRQLVWSKLHGQSYDVSSMEIDVIFYDQTVFSSFPHAIQSQLAGIFLRNTWDVVNQATVHEWYLSDLGEVIAPYQSLNDALLSWPDTATAIAVRLKENQQLEIVAPFGLDDLFELKLRWNPKLVHYETFMQRVISKQWLKRWPQLVYAEPLK